MCQSTATSDLSWHQITISAGCLRCDGISPELDLYFYPAEGGWQRLRCIKNIRKCNKKTLFLILNGRRSSFFNPRASMPGRLKPRSPCPRPAGISFIKLQRETGKLWNVWDCLYVECWGKDRKTSPCLLQSISVSILDKHNSNPGIAVESVDKDVRTSLMCHPRALKNRRVINRGLPSILRRVV